MRKSEPVYAHMGISRGVRLVRLGHSSVSWNGIFLYLFGAHIADRFGRVQQKAKKIGGTMGIQEQKTGSGRQQAVQICERKIAIAFTANIFRWLTCVLACTRPHCKQKEAVCAAACILYSIGSSILACTAWLPETEELFICQNKLGSLGCTLQLQSLWDISCARKVNQNELPHQGRSKSFDNLALLVMPSTDLIWSVTYTLLSLCSYYCFINSLALLLLSLTSYHT